MSFYNRVQQRYITQHLAPPTDIDIQEAWLLFNAHNDPVLLRQLLMLGGRGDLTDQQRMMVQTIWANWAVRRANENIAQGNARRALAILNAAAKAFPDNPDVLKALGSGYAAVGLSKQAVEIYRAQDLSTGTVDDYRAAVGAALVANDMKDAETWLRFGLDQYPRDGQLLVMAAKFETARGDSTRAAEYYKASLKVFPKEDPGSMLTDEMLHQLPVRRVQRVEESHDLATLLSQADPHVNRNGMGNNGIDLVDNPRPYLPSYAGTPAQAPVQIDQSLPNGYVSPQRGVPGGGYVGNTSPGVGRTRAYDPSSPAQQQQLEPRTTGPDPYQQQLEQQQRNSTLRDYTPQSRLQPMMPDATASASSKPVLFLHPDPAIEARFGPYVSYDPSAGLPHRVNVAAVDPSITARFTTASFHQQPAQGQQDPAQGQALHLSYPQPTQGDGTSPAVLPPSSYPVPPTYAAPVTQPGRQQNSSTASQGNGSEYTPQIDYQPPAHGYAPPKAIHLPSSESRHATAPHSVAVPPSSQSASPYSSEPAKEIYDKSFSTPTPGFKAPAATRAGPITSSRRSAYPQPGASRSTTQNAAQQGSTPDGTPIVPYIPASRATSARQTPQSVHDRAEAIRRNQMQAQQPLTGQSHPPADTYEADPDAQIQNTQFNPSTFQNGQIPQPGAPQDANTSSQGNMQPVAPSQSVAPNQQGNSYGQQYPQPNTRGTTTSQPLTRRRPHPTTSTPREQQPPPQQQAPVTYPGYTQPLANSGYPSIPAPYPLATPPSDYQLQQKDVPPLRGYFDPRVEENAPLSDRQQAELDLATLEGSYSSWIGASVIGSYRSGTKGIDRMASIEVPFEASAALGKAWRLTVIPMPIFLDSGVLNPGGNLGPFPVFGTVAGTSVQVFPQQYSVGLGGEAQLTSSTFSVAGGYSAYGFLVRNGIGRARWRPGNGHFTFFGGRDPVKDTQLSYAGLRDPGPGGTNPFTLGPIWGGVVQTGGGVRVDAGNEKSGMYMQAEGSVLTGFHVLDNHKYDGTFGAYFRAHVWPEYGSVNVGAAIFGEHYDYNERIESYGWGGYFSPNVYFLFAVPVTFNGHYKDQLHYSINGSVGVQTFQENSEPYYPLDQSLQLNLEGQNGICTGLAVGAAQPCGFIPNNSNTGLNYSIDARVAYQVNDHWYIGGFLTGNNTNNYNTVSGGFFARYTFKSQAHTADYPTGLFPVQGFRPLRVP